MSNNANIVEVANFTTLFKREILLYSLGDIKLSKPVSIKKVLYFLFFALIWAGPILAIFGIHLTFLYAALVLGPPALLGNLAGKPIWGGMSLFAWVKVQIQYLSEPPVYTDMEPNVKHLELQPYTWRIWIGRRREMGYLARL